jgi:hypothetical protein
MGEQFISLRYAITYDYLYSYKNNFYGKAIIKNARILSKDKLNRTLIDKETYKWFEKNINGFESLNTIKNNNIYGTTLKEIFKDNEQSTVDSYLYGDENKITTSICQKISEINVKNDKFFVYNLYLQIMMKICGNEKKGFIVPVGNLNPQGLGD